MRSNPDHTPPRSAPRAWLLGGAALLSAVLVMRFVGGWMPERVGALPLFGRYLATSSTPQGAGAADRTVYSLETLRSTYGDPPDANYGRMRIPSLHVDAPIGRRVVGRDGQLDDPTGASDVVWYDFAAIAGLGGTPGGGGNAVFAGHVDRAAFLAYAGVQYSGPGIFYSLDQLGSGEVIEVAVNGKTTRYAVQWVRELNASSADWREIVSSKVGGDAITLITCGGTFDRATHEYSHRTVVRALRA